jgi:hypothetical protein
LAVFFLYFFSRLRVENNLAFCLFQSCVYCMRARSVSGLVCHGYWTMVQDNDAPVECDALARLLASDIKELCSP